MSNLKYIVLARTLHGQFADTSMGLGARHLTDTTHFFLNKNYLKLQRIKENLKNKTLFIVVSKQKKDHIVITFEK